MQSAQDSPFSLYPITPILTRVGQNFQAFQELLLKTLDTFNIKTVMGQENMQASFKVLFLYAHKNYFDLVKNLWYAQVLLFASLKGVERHYQVPLVALSMFIPYAGVALCLSFLWSKKEQIHQ